MRITTRTERKVSPTRPRRGKWIVAISVAGILVAPSGASYVLAASKDARPKPNILLVHGAFADGSSWDRVVHRLVDDGYNVVSSQIPLTSFGDDVAAVQRDLRVLGGPTLIVAHSYGGAVITQAAQDAPNVVGLVYIAAVAPNIGEAASIFNQLAPPLPSQADFVPIDQPHVGQNNAPFVVIRRDKFGGDFCQDCRDTERELLTATETPTNASAFGTPLAGTPAWKQFTTWYQISTQDRIINPDAQRIMARRVDPTGVHTITLRSSHASLVSHAEQVAEFIERAAG
jgi:pimeloyl-ACP methyl ester carboxylesterase